MLSTLSDVSYSLYTNLFDNKSTLYILVCAAIVYCVMSVLCVAIVFSRKRGLDPKTAVTELDEYPMISVVMCCKGKHDHSLSNYKRNLAMKYPGPAEFIFVIEAVDDLAYDCATQAINETEYTQANRWAKIEISGVSYHNAQKVHNMMHGVSCCNEKSQYVFFVDDDVFLYPGLIEEMLDPLMKEPNRVLVSTGYEFILPSPKASIASYSLIIYRIHNLWSYITDRPVLCWGGSWFAPLWIFRQNYAKINDCYLDGGYSDDTIISCLIQQAGYVCAHPHRAIFPNMVAADLPFSKYWEFVVRQFWVLGAYCTPYNRRVGYSLAFLICSTVLLMAIWTIPAPFIGLLALLASTSGKLDWNITVIMSVVCFCLSFGLISSIMAATKMMLKVSNSVRPKDQQEENYMNPFKLAIGLAIHIVVLPFAVVKAMMSDSVLWAGIRYYRKNGKICKVDRPGPGGKMVTDDFSASIARAIKMQGLKAGVNGIEPSEVGGKRKLD